MNWQGGGKWRRFCGKKKCKMLDVKHYLNIYQLRMKMQDAGVTNPSQKIKSFTRELVEKMSTMPLDEEITLEGNSFYDSVIRTACTKLK